jgi:hypothetical protein
MSSTHQSAGPASAAEPINPSTSNMDSAAHKEIYEAGLEIRKRVLGEEYVENALAKGTTDFSRPLQQFATVCSKRPPSSSSSFSPRPLSVSSHLFFSLLSFLLSLTHEALSRIR